MSLPIELINEIDKRVQASLKNYNLLCRTSAKVVEIDPDRPFCKVVLYGDPHKKTYTFPYRRNTLVLQVGDTVYIESKINDLASGVISDKLFGIEEN